MLDLYKLHIFATVVQAGSFSAAGERLYMTQSAVSQHIKDLEASVGRTLFRRGWRGVRLTPHGEILHRYTGKILTLIAHAENALIDVENLTDGRISIGATPGIGIYLAPDWVQRFRGRYPQLTVALKTGVTSQIVADILAQQLEIAFIEGELHQNLPQGLAALELEKVEQYAVVGFKHPFWERETLSLGDLHGQSMIVRQPSSQSRIWLENTLEQHGVTPVIGAEFDNLESMKRAVMLGTCIAVLPPYVIQNEITQKHLHMIPLDDRPLTRSLKLIWDTRQPVSPITRAFLSELSGEYDVLNTLLLELDSLDE